MRADIFDLLLLVGMFLVVGSSYRGQNQDPSSARLEVAVLNAAATHLLPQLHRIASLTTKSMYHSVTSK